MFIDFVFKKSITFRFKTCLLKYVKINLQNLMINLQKNNLKIVRISRLAPYTGQDGTINLLSSTTSSKYSN